MLSKVEFWGNPSVWRHYGDNENNFATIGNQQSAPDTALVEKIINSVDAVLMRECLRRRIKPDDQEAPQSIQQALKEFFGIPDGKLSSVDAFVRTRLAQNILVVATGQKTNPSYSIIDLGEGQTPKNMPHTFLSLNKSNKLRIPFVQGKFNMGGTGSLQFCGRNNLQLIISRRDPKGAELETDETKHKWGFTIIRRESPKAGMRSSTFKYLAPKGEILMVDSIGLPLLPQDYPEPYGNILEWGSFVKLYEYELTSFKTLVVFDLYNRLSLLLPNIAFPIRMVERRKGYSGHTLEATLSGLSVRLEEDKRENLEQNFPSSSEIKVMGQEMKILIYAFKKGQREKYTRNEGIVFTVNGQSHGFLSKSFFERKSVGMSYLADSILLIIDCSKFDGRTREDLFMNSRDRLREGHFLLSEIEKQLEDLIKNHPGLRALREQRRREEIENRLQDSKPLTEVIEDIIKKSPSLSKLFLEGVRVINPFKVAGVNQQGDFQGKKFPNYFRVSKEYGEDRPKLCPKNRRFRLQFTTDAENEYFNRDKEPGEFTIKYDDHSIEDYSLNLWNGLATLTVELPDDVKTNDILPFNTAVSDISRINPFSNEFYVKVIPPEEKYEGGTGQRREPPGPEKGNGSYAPSCLSLPNIIEVRRDDWYKHGFHEDSALLVKDTGEVGYGFYINVDNMYLQTELKGNPKTDPRLLEARFKYGMVLIGISLLDHFENKEESEDISRIKNNSDQSIYEVISTFSKAIAPVLLPMIASLGDLEVNN